MELKDIAAFSALALGLYNAFRLEMKIISDKKSAQLKTILDLITNIEVDSKEYWTKPEEETITLGFKIISNIKKLNAEAEKTKKLLDEDFTDYLINFKKIITGGDFQVATRIKYEINSTKIQTISQGVDSLIKYFEKFN